MMQETILGIDPGPYESAYMRLTNRQPVLFGKVDNVELLRLMLADTLCLGAVVVIETIFPRGQAVGLETMDTQFWAGRYAQVAESQCREWHKIDRQDVRFAICGSLNTGDANVRQALIDYFGGDSKAIGNKREPGPLYRVKKDVWAALAIAMAWSMKQEQIGATA